MTPHPTARSTWWDGTFRVYAFARVVSVFGSSLTAVALPLLIFKQTQSALQTGILTALGVLPYLLFGLLAGAMSDRVNRKTLMVTCDLLSAALLLSVPLAQVLTGHTATGHVYLVAVGVASLYVWFDAASFGAMTTLVGKERVTDANSALWSAMTLMTMLGPAAAGVLVARFSPALVLGLDALSYLLSGLALLSIRQAFQHNRSEMQTGRTNTLGEDIRSGLRYVWNQPLIRVLTTLGFGMSFVGGGVTALLVVVAVRRLNLSTEDARLGWLYTATALGALCSTLLLPRLKRWPPTWVTLTGFLLAPFALAAIALAERLTAMLVALFVWQTVSSLVIINGISLRMRLTPDELQGRVNTVARMVAWGGSPFGALLAGWLTERWDVRLVLLGLAAVAILSAVRAWYSPLRDRELELDSVGIEAC